MKNTEPEFDIYTCDSGHMVLVERKPKWDKDPNRAVRTEIPCPVEREIAEYRTTVKLTELDEALQRYITERKKTDGIDALTVMVRRSNNCKRGSCQGQIHLQVCLKKQREKNCEMLPNERDS